MKKIIWGLVLLPLCLSSQEKLEGMVMEPSDQGHLPLSGANVYWLNSQLGTMTDGDGMFSIPYTGEYDKLVISYVGFETDTITVTSPEMFHHTLRPSQMLDEVVVEHSRSGVQKTFLSTANVVNINSAELLKAACCNLSESFETNPAIDVNFNDAITGTKQIQMLGLTSPYLLITQENIPMVRGASQAYGLSFIPGTWVESIQITKGGGSVLNGYESISGQINTELVKPFTDSPLFVNGFANANGRYELNTHFNKKLTEHWGTGLYVHGNTRNQKMDNNGDGFLDAPLADQVNIMNRWQYQNPDTGWVSFINVRFLNDEKQLGETDFDPFRDRGTTNSWGGEIDTRRFDSSLKLGYVFPDLPFQSIGFQASYSIHKQDSYFGFNQYNIDHQSLYSNAIFNSIIGNTQHQFKTGVTFALDTYSEWVNTTDYGRMDSSVGAFFEYNYDDLENLSLNAGLRVDTHNLLGTFLTPRLHLRYVPWENSSLRASLGKGRRAANIFAENQQLFGSSRQINVQDGNGKVYGLAPEVAWNYGVGFLQGFQLFGKKGNLSLDYYRTDFEQQVVVDWENPAMVSFYNLEGDSYANSFQVEMDYVPVRNLELRAAYKNYDVKTDYSDGRLQKPLQAKNRFFANVGYITQPNEKGAQWRLDYTLHTIGEQRLPAVPAPSAELLSDRFSDPYSLMNAQATRVFSRHFEVYVGVENLTNFMQEDAVLGAGDPFGDYFDTSIVYAPIMGATYYAGFRYKL
ncbi:MAG: TonB-dependent receptor [Sediminicola sp.]